jgi:apolipoprotein N-acyltransferase
MTHLRAVLKNYSLPILAGLLIGTSYIPFPPWAIFFGLVPLFVYWVSVAETPAQGFWGGWLAQFLLNLIGFHWIAYTATEFGHFPWWGGLLTLIGYAALAHLHYAVSGWIALHLRRHFKLSNQTFLFTAATLFALCDHRFPMIFPWHLGYPWLWAHWPGAQLADVIGFEGLNIATIFVNALLAWALILFLLNRRVASQNTSSGASSGALRSLRTPFIFAGAGLAVIAVLNLLGLGREKPWQENDAEVRVLVVQGNIGNFDKLMAELKSGFRVPIVNKYLSLTRQGLAQFPETQLILWPETAYPDLLDAGAVNYGLAPSLRTLTQTARVPLLTGGYSQEIRNRKRSDYNAFFHIDASGTVHSPPYRKTILLAFGETFPFSDYIPYMQTLLPDMGAFAQGSGPTNMSVLVHQKNGTEQRIALGPQICYEGLYPWFSSSLAAQGAQIFTNVTNDSWFGSDFEPYQHLYMTAARAIEMRRPLIRATNTGITTAVLASGEFLQQSPIGKEWFGEFRVAYKTQPPHTFYEKIAGLWGWVLAALLLILVGFGKSKKDTQ